MDELDLRIRRATYGRFAELGRAPTAIEIAEAVGEPDFRVDADGRSWWANCAWDALGIGAALDVDSEFDTHCPDCAEPIHVRVRDRRPDDTGPVFHVLVPAREWWNDIGFT